MPSLAANAQGAELHAHPDRGGVGLVPDRGADSALPGGDLHRHRRGRPDAETKIAYFNIYGYVGPMGCVRSAMQPYAVTLRKGESGDAGLHDAAGDKIEQKLAAHCFWRCRWPACVEAPADHAIADRDRAPELGPGRASRAAAAARLVEGVQRSAA